MSTNRKKLCPYATLFKLSALTLCVTSTFSIAQTGSTEQRLSELEARLSKLEQALNAKDKHIEQLEQKLEDKQNTQAKSATTISYQQDVTKTKPSHTFEQRPSHRFKAPERSIRLSGTDTRLQIGGQIWLDAIYNDGEMTNRAGFQPSSIAYEKDTVDDHTLLTAGQSKLYFKSFTPTKYGDMKTRFEFDMFQSDGNANFHLTHLWGELGNFGAGQTFTGFMDIDAFPNTLEYWGPNAMVFTRQPQVRYIFDLGQDDEFALSLERSDSDFAFVRNSNVATFNYDEVNELPDITAFYRKSGTFGHFKSSFILRKLGYETPVSSDKAIGWGLNLSGAYNITAQSAFKYQFVYGDGISRYINDPCCSLYASETGGSDAGLDRNGNLKLITATGGFAYLDHHWRDDLTSSVGLSYISLDNLSTQYANAFHKSLYSTVNVIWTPTLMSKVGIELQYGDVESFAGRTADNFRLQTSFGFKY